MAAVNRRLLLVLEACFLVIMGVFRPRRRRERQRTHVQDLNRSSSRGSHNAWHRPTCEVKIFLYMNLSYELIKHVHCCLCHFDGRRYQWYDPCHCWLQSSHWHVVAPWCCGGTYNFSICATHRMIVLQNTMQCSRYHSKDMYHLRKHWKHIK